MRELTPRQRMIEIVDRYTYTDYLLRWQQAYEGRIRATVSGLSGAGDMLICLMEPGTFGTLHAELCNMVTRSIHDRRRCALEIWLLLG